MADRSSGYQIGSAWLIDSRYVKTLKSSTFLAGHDNVALTIVADHFAHIFDMDNGNTSFGEASCGNKISAKFGNIEHILEFNGGYFSINKSINVDIPNSSYIQEMIIGNSNTPGVVIDGLKICEPAEFIGHVFRCPGVGEPCSIIFMGSVKFVFMGSVKLDTISFA